MNADINSESFDREVMQSELPVLLDFYATWCTPCRMLSDVLDEISEIYDGMIRVCRVNVDNEQELADRFGIYQIPTVILFNDGAPYDRFTGYRNREEIADLVLSSIMTY